MEKLQSFLQISLNKSTSDISKEELASIKNLVLDGVETGYYQMYNPSILNDFIYLEHLTLKNLSVNKGWINEIIKLSHLDNISFINCDIETIKDLIKIRLKNIELKSSHCNDIEEINNFKNLNYISLIDMDLPSLNILKNLPNLLELKLSGSKFKDTQILRTFDRIENLSIDGTDIMDLDFINDHINLKKLCLSKEQIDKNSKLVDDLIYLKIDVYEDGVIHLNKIWESKEKDN